MYTQHRTHSPKARAWPTGSPRRIPADRRRISPVGPRLSPSARNATSAARGALSKAINRWQLPAAVGGLALAMLAEEIFGGDPVAYPPPKVVLPPSFSGLTYIGEFWGRGKAIYDSAPRGPVYPGSYGFTKSKAVFGVAPGVTPQNGYEYFNSYGVPWSAQWCWLARSIDGCSARSLEYAQLWQFPLKSPHIAGDISHR